VSTFLLLGYYLPLQALKRLEAGKPVLMLNVGNPHALGQQPITFMRQVLAIMMHPPLLDDPRSAATFPSDVVKRAKTYLALVKVHRRSA
jgi:hypothetical protein